MEQKFEIVRTFIDNFVWEGEKFSNVFDVASMVKVSVK